MNTSILRKGMVTVFILAVFVSAAPAAPETEPKPDRPNSRDDRDAQDAAGGWFGGFDRDAMQERIMELYKKELGITDEEWTVLLPRLDKVRQMKEKIRNMEAMIQWSVLVRPQVDAMMKQNQDDNPWGGMVQMFMDRMQQEQAAQAKRAIEEGDAVQTTLTELQETLRKPAPTAAEIRNKMMSFRGAKEKLRQELAQAQQELRELLTLKQEALLLMMGMLE